MASKEVSTSDQRYVRDYKCQVSVGELYRWILSQLTEKDIKKALHKYRDLMPRQSDWNRKLTQATTMPELGFRYLYRCGQIDENNHRTMQKMLKYIDRQDVLPYFDTIIYNTNNANSSLETLQSVLLDSIESFLKKNNLNSESLIHPEPPYEVSQCQPLESIRVTRSQTKRKRCGEDLKKCVTVAKKPRRNSQSTSSTDIIATPASPNADTNLSRAQELFSQNAVGVPMPILPPGLVLQVPRAVVPQFPRIFVPQLINQPFANGDPPPPLMPLPGGVAMAAGPGPNGGAGLRLQGTSIFSLTAADIGTQFSCRLRLRIRLYQIGGLKELLNGVNSDRQENFERQLDLFTQTGNALRQREAGEIVCDVRFTDLLYLEAFWSDYITGTLKQSMRDILMMDLPQDSPSAPGSPPGVHERRRNFDLHVSISKREYESGKQLLLQNLLERPVTTIVNSDTSQDARASRPSNASLAMDAIRQQHPNMFQNL